MALSDEQKFQFDLSGYVVIPGVLSQSQCDEYSRLSDDAWPRKKDDGSFRRKEQIMKWGKQFLDLMDHPRILPVLVELIGPRLRIDHAYCMFMQAGETQLNLHGGPRLFETDHWYYYQDGVMRNGLTVATWNLTDAPEGAGGFTCIPGSHKTNFMRSLPKDVREFARAVDYVKQPALKAGDVLIFTEALMHGTKPWTANHERRTLLYKYSPPHSSWRKVPYVQEDYPLASEQQLRLIAPPSIEDHPPVVTGDED